MKILLMLLALVLLTACGPSNNQPHPDVSKWGTAKWDQGKWDK